MADFWTSLAPLPDTRRRQRWPADAYDRACVFRRLDWLPGQPKARMTSASAATAPSISVSLMLP